LEFQLYFTTVTKQIITAYTNPSRWHQCLLSVGGNKSTWTKPTSL